MEAEQVGYPVADQVAHDEACAMSSAELDQAFRDLFRDMADAWRAAPPPEGIHLVEADLHGLGEVGVVAVIHGWMARLVRTGEGALILGQAGYGEEVSPLVRSMIEHAIGLWWLVDQRGDAFQALARARSTQMSRLDAAQKKGWSVGDEETQRLLKDAIDLQTDETNKSNDRLLHVAHQAETYGLADFFQGWLIESWSSHASFASARAYYVQEDGDDSGSFHLLDVPQQGHREVAAAVASATHTGLVAYDQLLAGQPLSERLLVSQRRFEELGALLAKENTDSRGAAPTAG